MAMQRKRRRRSGGNNNVNNNPNKHFDSNGPDVRIRGSAQQISERYLQYARDAQTSGDRIKAEALFQHAEHYTRIVAAFEKQKDRERKLRESQDAAKAAERAARHSGEAVPGVTGNTGNNDAVAAPDSGKPAQNKRKPHINPETADFKNADSPQTGSDHTDSADIPSGQ